MAEKNVKRQLLIEKRARALAAMLLSRRDDLEIDERNGELAPDYIVRFQSERAPGQREFGIELHSAWDAVATKEQASVVLRPFLHEMKLRGPFGYPICFFLFAMENDGAWYSWALEPEGGRLRLREEPDCRRLDKRALQEIVERVDDWYQDFFRGLILNGPGASASRGRR